MARVAAAASQEASTALKDNGDDDDDGYESEDDGWGEEGESEDLDLSASKAGSRACCPTRSSARRIRAAGG